jgi:D-alanine-D-alanine ligase
MTLGEHMKVVVLMGGVSGERDVSLASGVQVIRALREAGHEVVGVDTSHGVLTSQAEVDLLEAAIHHPGPPILPQDMLKTGNVGLLANDPRTAGLDVVFLALHGGSGEDGTIQTLLQVAGIPFVGSGPMGCALAMDKDVSKRLARDAGVPTPPWITVEGWDDGLSRWEEILSRLGLPLIVKPPSGGSTLGLTLVHDEAEVREALALCLEYDERAMFEKYVRGREVTVGVLGSEALPVGEIIPEREIFDYDCKYRPGMAQEIFPAALPQDVARNVQDTALVAHWVQRLRDYSRVDFILDGAGVPWYLEANALPGLTANSLLPRAGRAAGIPFSELCHRLAVMAVKRGSGREGGKEADAVAPRNSRVTGGV